MNLENMNALKRYAGIIWILLGPVLLGFLLRTAAREVARNNSTDTWVQWGVFITIFIPIAIGLVLFGWYALRGEYDHLPENSTEVE
jgi:predicted Na+-dependent transporter